MLNLDTVGSMERYRSERWRGRGHHMGRCVFGERLWHRVGPLTDRTRAEDRMESGIFVGFQLKSSEYILFANGEAIIGRTIRSRLVSERSANPEEIISVSGHGTDFGHRQEAAVRPMGERRGLNHELDEALLPKPPASAGPSKRVYLKQSDFDAHGLTQECPGAEQCEKAHEHKVTQRYAAQEWKNCLKEQRRANNDWKRLIAAHGTRPAERAAERIKLQFADRPVDPASSSSASPSDATAGGDVASAGSIVAGGVAQHAAQDTVMSEGADGRRTSPREGQDDEERGKTTAHGEDRIVDGSVKCGADQGQPKNPGPAT